VEGRVTLALAQDLNGEQHRLMAELAKTAAAKWEEEQHPGWIPAGVDSEPLLADLQRFQVSTACSISVFLASHLPSVCWHRVLLLIPPLIWVGAYCNAGWQHWSHHTPVC